MTDKWCYKVLSKQGEYSLKSLDFRKRLSVGLGDSIPNLLEKVLYMGQLEAQQPARSSTFTDKKKTEVV